MFAFRKIDVSSILWFGVFVACLLLSQQRSRFLRIILWSCTAMFQNHEVRYVTKIHCNFPQTCHPKSDNNCQPIFEKHDKLKCWEAFRNTWVNLGRCRTISVLQDMKSSEISTNNLVNCRPIILGPWYRKLTNFPSINMTHEETQVH